MPPYKRRSMLCPNCRRLISGDESACPYCGLKKPTSPWQRLLGRGLNDGDQLLKILIGVNVAMYILSLLFSARSTGFSLSPDKLSLVWLGASGSIPIANYHWADTNQDNRIVDDEILEAYDLFSGLDELDYDWQEIDDIWSGEGYHWDEAEQKYVILP